MKTCHLQWSQEAAKVHTDCYNKCTLHQHVWASRAISRYCNYEKDTGNTNIYVNKRDLTEIYWFIICVYRSMCVCLSEDGDAGCSCWCATACGVDNQTYCCVGCVMTVARVRIGRTLNSTVLWRVARSRLETSRHVRKNLLLSSLFWRLEDFVCPERALSRHSVDVLLMSPLVLQTAVMVWTGQRALTRTSLYSRRLYGRYLFNNDVRRSDCVVSMSGWLVNSESVAGDLRSVVKLFSRNWVKSQNIPVTSLLSQDGSRIRVGGVSLGSNYSMEGWFW